MKMKFSFNIFRIKTIFRLLRHEAVCHMHILPAPLAVDIFYRSTHSHSSSIASSQQTADIFIWRLLFPLQITAGSAEEVTVQPSYICCVISSY